MVLLISTLVFSANGFSQSAAESLDRLHAKFNSIKQSVMFAISSVSDHPDSLENGSLGTTLETAANKELTNLLTQLQQQSQILKEKEQGLIKNSVLSQNEKEELRGDLRKQSKPLKALIDTVSHFKDAIIDLRETQLTVWKQTYNQFKDIYGAQKATDKLRGLAEAFCKPYGSLPKQETEALGGTGRSQSPVHASEPMTYQSTLATSTSIPVVPIKPTDILPTADAIPFRLEEIQVNKGIVKSIRSGDGLVSLTLLNQTQERKKVHFRVIILNKQGVVLSDGEVSWIFKQLEPGAEALVDTTFKCKEPENIKFSSCHPNFDLSPAWILLRGDNGDVGFDGIKIPEVQRSKQETKYLQSISAQPAVSDPLPVSQEIEVGRGILKRISISQGRVNVMLENTSSEKKPVGFLIYLLNKNGFIVGKQSVTWYFKQMDPGSKTIEGFVPKLKDLEELRHSIFRGSDSAPKWIIIRKSDDSPYQG